MSAEKVPFHSPTRVVVVGGGTAGWMSAALLSVMTRNRLAEIVLIESDEIGTVGVGEATIPAIKRFNRLLQIDEADFIRSTKATFKLGIEFVNWGREGTRYFHPFGQIGFPIGRTGFEHFLARRRLEGVEESFEDYSLNSIAARENRFAVYPQDPLLSKLSYAYHFDAGLYALFLRKLAEERGTKRVEGTITKVHQNATSGDVESVTLASGKVISGDLFIDCSGLSGLLIEKTLKAGYEDWSAFLPCNSAVFMPSARVTPLTPYTRSTAHKAGWQWRIPLQHRIGNGHVFCSDFTSVEEAITVLEQGLDSEPLATAKALRFTTGRRKLSWSHNVVAIGLSSGFLEPLESTSIHLIQSGLVKLLDLWPRSEINPVLRRQYNRAMQNQFESIRDFIILHYKATEREDSDFWKYCRHMPVPDSLREKMEHFQAYSRIILTPGELFQPESWLAVMLGQHLRPESYDPFADLVEPTHVTDLFLAHARKLRRAVQTVPHHEAFLQGLLNQETYR